MKNRLSIILCISIISLTFIFTGCRKDSFVDDKINNGPDPTVNMVIDINGVILDQQNMPIENVQVKVGNKMNQTDENGVFLLRQVTVNDAGTRLKAEKDGFFDQYRIVYPHITKEKVFVQLEMVDKGEATKFQSGSGAEVTFNNGAKVRFPANSIVDNVGNSYTGEVNVYSHWYDPTDPNIALNSPANLEGINTEGDQVVLSTYGMVAVELESDLGEKLQIGNDQLAELTFPIPNTLLADAPESIPLWSVDNNTGLWVQEFSANKVGTEYIGSVNHFSFWNCDVPNDFINLEGYLKTIDGTPVANKAITISLNTANSAVGYTNNLGYFEGKVPNDELLIMSISSCNEVVLEIEIGPFSTDTDLGDVIVDLLIESTNIATELKGCVGEDLSGAYGLLNGYQLLSADSDGVISGVYTACSNTTHTIKFYDGINANVSDELSVDLSMNTNDYGMITVCEQLGEFISFSADGGDYWLIENPESFIINGNEISLIGENSTAGYGFRTTIAGVNTGSYNPTSTFSYLPPDSSFPNGAYMQCSDNPNANFICDQFSVELLEVDMMNEMISGTFEGYLRNSPDATGGEVEDVFVQGTFRSKITDQFNSGTINGRVWVDLDGNGTREGADEEEACVNILRLTRTSDNGVIQLGTIQAYPEDGMYSFTGIRPGTYKINIFAANYDVTDYQVGNPANDNDFQEITGNNTFETDYITIGDGEVIENIDLGFKAPDVVSAFIYSYGCEPNINLSYVISGGLKPYSVQLNDDPAIVVDGSGVFEVPTGGTYELTVTDALNNSSNNMVVALSYTNRVAGLVWEDKAGGTEGLFDNGDNIISETIIQLFDSSDQFINEMISGDEGGYFFNDIAPGDYYVKMEIPSGLQLSDLVDEDFYGNDILPSGISPVFTISDCNESVRINAAFKPE